MNITSETVKYIAELSRLKIENEEVEGLCKEINSILDYMNMINATVNTEGADADRIPQLVSVARDDVIEKSYDRELLLQNAPEHTSETPIVPKTVE